MPLPVSQYSQKKVFDGNEQNTARDDLLKGQFPPELIARALDYNLATTEIKDIAKDLLAAAQVLGVENVEEVVEELIARIVALEGLGASPTMLTVATTGVDIDPNDAGAPLIIKDAPFGTTYQQETPAREWRKDPDDTWIQTAVGRSSPENKNMVSLATTVDGDKATNTTVALAPVFGGTVDVFINGAKVSVGNGVKTEDCYFSTDGGTTALLLSGIVVGATLHWVGSVAGYELDTLEQIDFIYVIP